MNTSVIGNPNSFINLNKLPNVDSGEIGASKSLDNAGFVQQAKTTTVDSKEGKQNQATLVQQATSNMVGVDQRIPDLTKPSAEMNPALLNKQQELCATASPITPAQANSIIETAKQQVNALVEKATSGGLSFLGGRAATLMALLHKVVDATKSLMHSEKEMSKKMVMTSYDNLKAAGEHKIDGAKAQVRQSISSGVTAMGFATAGGIQTHRGHNKNIAGLNMQGKTITDHKLLGNNLTTKATPTKASDINNGQVQNDINRLQNPGNHQHILAQHHERQLQVTGHLSQQSINIGQTMSASGNSAASMISAHNIVDKANEDVQADLKMGAKDIHAQQAQTSTNNAQDAQRSMDQALAAAESLARSNNDVSSVIASNTKM